jgi:hypothetical protein
VIETVSDLRKLLRGIPGDTPIRLATEPNLHSYVVPICDAILRATSLKKFKGIILASNGYEPLDCEKLRVFKPQRYPAGTYRSDASAFTRT